MGYIIKISYCPLLLVSNLQTEVTLSDLHHEYVTLPKCFEGLVVAEEYHQGIHWVIILGYFKSEVCIKVHSL